MPNFLWNLQQGSIDWYRARSGIPTASEFGSIMTPQTMKPSASRKKYACRLIAERLMRWQADSLDKIGHIADGKAHEPIAAAKMELVFDIETTPIGFVKTDDGRFGASPDRVAGISPDRTSVNTVIEIKSPTIPVQFERLLMGDDDAYRCQRQGQLWVAQADKAIFFSSNPRMPDYVVEDGRDEAFLSKLVDCLERFHDELEAWTAKAKGLGTYEAFAEMVSPVDAEHGENFRTGPAATEAEIDDLINGPTSKRYAWGG